MIKKAIHHFSLFSLFLCSFLILALFFSCQNPKKSAKTSKNNENTDDYYLLIGTYSPKDTTGIFVYTFNSSTGEATFKSGIDGIENPSFLTPSPDYSSIYAVSETNTNNDGKVYAYAFDRTSGELSFKNQLRVDGGSPCYISIDPLKKTLFVSNYSSGNLSLVSLKEDGSLDTLSQNIKHHGKGIKLPNQNQAHVHSAILGPDHKNLFVTDLGLDKIFTYPYDSDSGSISETADTISVTAGSGPRHMAFSSNGEYLYTIHELGGQLTTFKQEKGHYTQIDEISNLPEDYDGDAPESSDIHITPDGKFLYASNRDGLNDIVAYKINPESGKPKLIDRYATGGKTPRVFTISPDGKFILAGHQRGAEITVFNRDLETGELKPLKDLSIPVARAVYLKLFPIQPQH